MERPYQLFPQVGRAKELALAFTRVVRERSPAEFNDWLRSAVRSKRQKFVSFARGLSEDYVAVTNAPRYGWSNGQPGGQVNVVDVD